MSSPAELAYSSRPFSCFVPYVERTDQIQASVHELLRQKGGTTGSKTVYDVLDAGLGSVRDLVDGEIDPLVERTAVDPLGACVPAFDGGWIQQLLAH